MSFRHFRDVWFILFYLFIFFLPFYRIFSKFYAQILDPNQVPHSILRRLIGSTMFAAFIFIPRSKGSGDIAISLASVHPSIHIFVSAV